MNRRERLCYLMGAAIMRHLDDTNIWAPRTAELDAIGAVLTRRLNDDEIIKVIAGTGWDFPGWLGDDPGDPDQQSLPFPPPGGFSEADIPF